MSHLRQEQLGPLCLGSGRELTLRPQGRLRAGKSIRRWGWRFSVKCDFDDGDGEGDGDGDDRCEWRREGICTRAAICIRGRSMRKSEEDGAASARSIEFRLSHGGIFPLTTDQFFHCLIK